MLTLRMISQVQMLMLYCCKDMPKAYQRLERIETWLLKRFAEMD